MWFKQKYNLSYTDKELKRTILEAIKDRQGKSIFDYDLSAFDNVICQNFVICHGNSTTQVSAIADNVISEVKEKHDLSAWSKTGTDNNYWIVIDYGSVNIHIFLNEYRDYYKLDDLWADAKVEKIVEA